MKRFIREDAAASRPHDQGLAPAAGDWPAVRVPGEPFWDEAIGAVAALTIPSRRRLALGTRATTLRGVEQRGSSSGSLPRGRKFKSCCRNQAVFQIENGKCYGGFLRPR